MVLQRSFDFFHFLLLLILYTCASIVVMSNSYAQAEELTGNGHASTPIEIHLIIKNLTQ